MTRISRLHLLAAALGSVSETQRQASFMMRIEAMAAKAKHVCDIMQRPFDAASAITALKAEIEALVYPTLLTAEDGLAMVEDVMANWCGAGCQPIVARAGTVRDIPVRTWFDGPGVWSAEVAGEMIDARFLDGVAARVAAEQAAHTRAETPVKVDVFEHGKLTSTITELRIIAGADDITPIPESPETRERRQRWFAEILGRHREVDEAVQRVAQSLGLAGAADKAQVAAEKLAAAATKVPRTLAELRAAGVTIGQDFAARPDAAVAITEAKRPPDKAVERPLHPAGRCTCAGEGTCEWCDMNRRRELREQRVQRRRGLTEQEKRDYMEADPTDPEIVDDIEGNLRRFAANERTRKRSTHQHRQARRRRRGW